VGQDHGAEGGGDEQRRGDLEDPDVLAEDEVGQPVDVAGVAVDVSSPTGSGSTIEPTAEAMTPSRPRARTAAAMRWPRIVSTSESEESTPTSMRTKRKSIITAPV
jgi:hypothetical protein